MEYICDLKVLNKNDYTAQVVIGRDKYACHAIKRRGLRSYITEYIVDNNRSEKMRGVVSTKAFMRFVYECRIDVFHDEKNIFSMIQPTPIIPIYHIECNGETYKISFLKRDRSIEKLGYRITQNNSDGIQACMSTNCGLGVEREICVFMTYYNWCTIVDLDKI